MRVCVRFLYELHLTTKFVKEAQSIERAKAQCEPYTPRLAF